MALWGTCGACYWYQKDYGGIKACNEERDPWELCQNKQFRPAKLRHAGKQKKLGD
jgi:hypothetical protein